MATSTATMAQSQKALVRLRRLRPGVRRFTSSSCGLAGVVGALRSRLGDAGALAPCGISPNALRWGRASLAYGGVLVPSCPLVRRHLTHAEIPRGDLVRIFSRRSSRFS